MQVLLTLQPIFNKDKEVFAYQIQYKKGKEEGDENDAYRIIIDTIQTMGLERFCGGKPAFLTFTEQLIKQEVPTLLPPDKVILEIARPEEVDEELLEKLSELKKVNFTMAFEQYIFETEYRDMLKFADIIKVDFSDVDIERKQQIIDYCARNKKSVLATRLEYNANFEYAKYIGCKFFQGYFFSRPEIVEVTDVAPFKFNYLELVNKVNRPEVDFEEIADIISRDVTLSYKLLRLVNSVAFGFRNRIESIKHAAVVLGEKELKKWVAFLAINGIVDDKPSEIVRVSLFRAKFGELLVKNTELKAKANEVFMMGIFSMLDVIMGRPLKELFEGLHLSEDVEKALLEGDGPYDTLFSFIVAYEKCDWDEVDELMQKLGWDENYIIEVYLKANSWCNELLDETFMILE